MTTTWCPMHCWNTVYCAWRRGEQRKPSNFWRPQSKFVLTGNLLYLFNSNVHSLQIEPIIRSLDQFPKGGTDTFTKVPFTLMRFQLNIYKLRLASTLLRHLRQAKTKSFNNLKTLILIWKNWCSVSVQTFKAETELIGLLHFHIVMGIRFRLYIGWRSFEAQ